ncbi:hypothetical protein [Anaerovibrio sp. RM50]|uniref:hypothetical protein n=1 Tax=Anaerovibrio sp. RM50 TaxID=1200557 RepID=UPI0004849F7A|nr:hypothetical protein [Anaerovibrio sp. RM50]
MRLLFVCSTEFQILNALNVKLHLYPDTKADIVLQRAEYSVIAERLRELGIFEYVCCAKEILIDLHEYKRALREFGRCDKGLLEAVCNSMVNIWRNLFGFFAGPKYHLNDLLYGYGNIRDNHYDKVLMQGGNTIVRNFYTDLHKNTEMAVLDEGIGSYCDNTICHKDTKADAVYLYDPNVAVYAEDQDISFVKIPKLSPDDIDFVNIANKVFRYLPAGKKIKNKLIFFDQGGEQMPSYLRNPNWLIRLFLANSIKKHTRSYKEYISQIKAFKHIAGDRTVYIKYHPRTSVGMLKEYDEAKFKPIEPRKIPWELYAINNQIEECKFITLCSSSVCLYPLTVGGNNKCVLLYSCIDYSVGDNYKKLFDNIAQKYKKMFFIANDIDGISAI